MIHSGLGRSYIILRPGTHADAAVFQLPHGTIARVVKGVMTAQHGLPEILEPSQIARRYRSLALDLRPREFHRVTAPPRRVLLALLLRKFAP